MTSGLPQAGLRVSLRRVRADGAAGDLVGFVTAADPARVVLRDRAGQVHNVPWSRVLAWRQVGVARGRDPVRASRELLAELAGEAGVAGRVFVARLCDLLDGRPPRPLGPVGCPPPHPAVLRAEWVTTDGLGDLLGVAWWASHADARSIQVRTTDDAVAARLAGLGFTELAGRA